MKRAFAFSEFLSRQKKNSFARTHTNTYIHPHLSARRTMYVYGGFVRLSYYRNTHTAYAHAICKTKTYTAVFLWQRIHALHLKKGWNFYYCMNLYALPMAHYILNTVSMWIGCIFPENARISFAHLMVRSANTLCAGIFLHILHTFMHYTRNI